MDLLTLLIHLLHSGTASVTAYRWRRSPLLGSLLMTVSNRANRVIIPDADDDITAVIACPMCGAQSRLADEVPIAMPPGCEGIALSMRCGGSEGHEFMVALSAEVEGTVVYTVTT